MTTTYDKDGAYIEVTVDGVVHRRSIKWEDCVVSVPSGANLKIDSAYVNESEQLVLVLEDESEIIIAGAEDLEAHDTDIKALLATIAAYIDTEVATILAAVDTEVAAIETKLDSPANFKADVSALALEASLDTHDTAIKNLLATITGYLDTEIAAILAAVDTEVAAIEVKLDTPANFMADLSTLETRLSATRAGYLDQLDFALAEAIAALQTDLDNPSQYMANVASLALEATLTAIKGGGWSTQTLVAIKAAIDAIPTTAMRGTDDAATEAKQDIIDGIVDDILADTAALEIASAKQLFTMDFWSASLEEASLDGDTAATITLPTVTIADLPATATIVHAVVMFKFRMIENTHATIANKLDGATVAATSQVIQIDKSGATFIDAINFVDDQFGIAAATREGGDVIIGSIDVASEVDANDTYELRWLLALADEDLLNFNDVQVGIRIWYSV